MNDQPPFSTWSRIYTAIAIYLAALITLFYLFSRAFSG